MNSYKEKLISWLFETKAVRVCPKDKPFWYTSGTIGPYYINTHFLYGNEDKANELLKLIDDLKEDKMRCALAVEEHTKNNYNTDPIYRGLIDEIIRFISSNIGFENIDYISGGERRDWFFSLIIADIIGKPHITIYKDLSSVILYKGEVSLADKLDGKKVLHIADLITQASSYERAWLPAVRKLGGEIKWSVVVVDRMQGGAGLLETEGVEPHAMIEIGKSLFDKAFKMGLIDERQHAMVIAYIKNPREAVMNFLKEHPQFIENALKEDDRTRERALLCIEKNMYGLGTKG